MSGSAHQSGVGAGGFMECVNDLKKQILQQCDPPKEEVNFDNIDDNKTPVQAKMDDKPAKPAAPIDDKPAAPPKIDINPGGNGPTTPHPRPKVNTKDPRPEGRDLPKDFLVAKPGQEREVHLSLFGRDFGENARNIVSWLTYRSLLEEPFAKPPTDPWMFCWEEVWDPVSPSRDIDGEKLVHELAKIIREKKGALFVDPVFPPTNESLFAAAQNAGANANAKQSFRKDQDPFLAGVTDIVWKRPREMCEATGEIPVMFSGTISPDDVAQGRLGNCYFLAALSACGIGESDALVKDLIIEDCADVGLYGVKFFLHGKWVTVIVDDLIPCQRKGSSSTGPIYKPIFACPKPHSEQHAGQMEIWPMIFEKAWAKLHLSYESTAGGLTGDTHNYLTGGSVTSYSFDEISKEELWQLMSKFLSDDSAFLSCAGVTDADGSAIDMGLITGHAYSVLKVVQAQGVRLVQIRNPWGSTEWKGDYSDTSKLWTRELANACGHEDENDGTFFMTIDDFVKWFGEIDICDPMNIAKLSESAFARLDTFASCWASEKTAGGPNSCIKTFKYNPTCQLTVSRTGMVEFSTYKRDSRPLKGRPDQERKMQPKVLVYLRDTSSPNNKPVEVVDLHGWQRMASKCVEMKAGVMYEVICSTWAPGVTGMCWVTVAGHGATFTPKAFATPNAEEAQIMKDQGLGGKMVCVECKADLKSFFDGVTGPMCKTCNTAANKIICAGACRRDIQYEAFYTTDTGKVCVNCYKH